MPTALHTPKHFDLQDIEPHDFTYDLSIEPYTVRTSRAGFWRKLIHGIIELFAPRPRTYPTLVYDKALRGFESPMDRCMREHPSLLATYVHAIL
jgi:hypothetical protein